MRRKKTTEQREREEALRAVASLQSVDPVTTPEGAALCERLRNLKPCERVELYGAVVERGPGSVPFVRVVEPWCGRRLSCLLGPVQPVVRRLMLMRLLEGWGAPDAPAGEGLPAAPGRP